MKGMKNWMRCYEYSYCNENNEDVTEILSEMEILELYWKYWYSRMVEKFGSDHPEITVRNCIDDWVVVNWAVELV